jgi:hypothetical protein
MSTASITIQYEDRNGAWQTASQSFICGNDELQPGLATFTGLSMYVPVNGDASLNVYVDIANIAQGAFSGAVGAITLLANEGFSATGDSGAVVKSAGWWDYQIGNQFVVRKSKPTFTKLDAGTDPVNGPLYRFSVVADNAGNIEIKQLGFQIRATGCDVAGLYLFDPSASTRLTDIPEDPINEYPFDGDVFLPVGTFNWYDQRDVLTIGTTPRVFEVRGTVTGYSEPGDSITVAFGQEIPISPNSTAYDMGDGCWSHIIWSDRSAPSHTVSTGDWTNGHLVEGLDGVQTFAK